MKTRRVRAAAGILGISAVFVLSVVTACSNAGEGERCEFDNGNDDCQDGLICIPASSRQGAPYVVNKDYANSDRCCPLDRKLATHPACIDIGGGGGTTEAGAGDALPPPPPPPPPPPGTDGGADADAGSDAADAADG